MHHGSHERPPDGRGFATFAEEPGDGRPIVPQVPAPSPEEHRALEAQWRMFGRVATGVAVLTAPLFFLVLTRAVDLTTAGALILTVVAVAAFRGLVDLITRRFIPSPSLFGADAAAREREVTDRRRTWFWRFWYRLALLLAAVYVLAALVVLVVQAFQGEVDVAEAFSAPLRPVRDQFLVAGTASGMLGIALTIVALFAINTLIFLGPLLYAGIRQVKVYEPGDVRWGTHIDDVRGQDAAKEAITQLVTLWQSPEHFTRAGGRPERGVLFLGPPGTGKTMLARAIATHFNCPFVTAPGPAFSQSFIGVDVLLVMWLTWRARRLSRKWGGKCIVFIDEIDALGLRRSALTASVRPTSIHDVDFHGPMGSITSSGDLLLETEAWRERLFAARAPEPAAPGLAARLGDRIRGFVFPGTGTIGQGGLQQLLVEMDGIATPPMLRRTFVNRTNTVLDALYVVPRRIRGRSLRLPPARPRREDLYFVGACNVPFEALDPALTRPGRMGRSVLFRTPTRAARRDIIDLYLGQIAREPDLDTDARRDEFARITMGHSPAMIQQTCSLALSRAHFQGRGAASWDDVVDAITTVEWGIDQRLDYVPAEAMAIAVHEAGHAVTGHVYKKGHSSTRLSIRARAVGYGHHAMGEIDERYIHFQHEEYADLIWSLGAMAAEHVFFGENSQGVGGDIASATHTAAMMVGMWGMAPRRPSLHIPTATATQREIAERRLMRRYEQLGTRILNRASAGSPLEGDPVAATLADEHKRRMVAQLLGQAFMDAYWLVRANRLGTERIARALVERREIFGDDVVHLLDGVDLRVPEIDPIDEVNWPPI